jgi:crotonobetainyl-CoA:carnitine CoA-transferase CaiB-like acyl-CoA transferase
VLQRHDVPATRIYTMADIFRDPHFAARQAIAAAPDADLGSIKMANVFPRLSMTPGKIRHAGGGTVGGDTRAVLRELTLTDAEIDALEAAGIVRCGA